MFGWLKRRRSTDTTETANERIANRDPSGPRGDSLTDKTHRLVEDDGELSAKTHQLVDDLGELSPETRRLVE